MSRMLVLFLIAGLLVTGAASAQDLVPNPDNDPLSGSVIVSSLLPDPYLTTVYYGPGSAVFPNCSGRFGVSPSFAVQYYDATMPISFFTFSDGDPVLAVVGPDGVVTCGDDADNTLEPLVTISAPVPGRYAVYVGGYGTDELQTAFLVVTRGARTPATFGPEAIVGRSLTGAVRAQAADAAGSVVGTSSTGAVSAAALTSAALMFDGPAPALTLQNGAFASRTLETTGGGALDLGAMTDLGAVCAGFVSPLPTLLIDLTGPVSGLSFEVESDEDAVLLVRDPNGVITCNDDAGSGTFNPRVALANAPAGRYSIYVGAYPEGALISGTLTISEGQG